MSSAVDGRREIDVNLFGCDIAYSTKLNLFIQQGFPDMRFVILFADLLAIVHDFFDSEFMSKMFGQYIESDISKSYNQRI